MKHSSFFKKEKSNFTNIVFCSMYKYKELLKTNKIDKNTIYFTDNSITNSNEEVK